MRDRTFSKSRMRRPEEAPKALTERLQRQIETKYIHPRLTQ